MTWVRGPWWDGCWLLSGLPLGIVFALLALWVPPYLLLVVGVIVFQTGHNLSPMLLAWTHRGFRGYALGHPRRFIVVPAIIIVGTTIAGVIGGLYWPPLKFNPATLKIDDATLSHPLWAIGFIYGYWNIYHFGKQNFGIMSIYRQKADCYAANQRRFDLVYSCLTAWAIMTISLFVAANHFLRQWYLVHHQSLGHYGTQVVYWMIWAVNYYQVLTCYAAIAAAGAAFMLWREWHQARMSFPRIALIITNGIGLGTAMVWPILALGIVSMNHWLTAIGLAGHASSRPLLLSIGAILSGIALFCVLFPDLGHFAIPTAVAAWAIGFRLGIGVVHFLYDRWVWRLSDPQVRAMVGIC